MNQGKYVFTQVAAFLPGRVFDRCVKHYSGNYYVKHFKCWNQLLSMMFGQLSGRDSLRDLLISISAHRSKFYHLGFGKNVSRSNLATANEIRDYRIFEELAYEMIAEARSCCQKDADFTLSIENPVYAFDSTMIDLCLSVFWWAEFRKAKAAVKIHTLYDIRTSIPCFIHITDGATHDVHGLDVLTYEAQGFYVLDRGYVDFARLYNIQQQKAYFVTRAKDNFRFIRISAGKPDKKAGVTCDQCVKAKGFYSNKHYPDSLRRIRFIDNETGRRMVFLTNNFDLPAVDIALLYKYRWKVELFFKWIKQHLKVKSFWGNSQNAVKTQIYIAIITYTLVAIVKSKMKSTLSTYEILQILSVSLLDRTPLKELLANQINQDVKEQNDIQLKIKLI